LTQGQHMNTATPTAADDSGGPSLAGGYAVTVRRAFPGTADQVAGVRKFVGLALGPVPVLDEAVLLASELATNAVLHTASGNGGAFGVAVRRYPSAVRIEVRDAGSRRVPIPRLRDSLAEDGRGLDLINLMADKWGHTGDQDGRPVFFELRW
jgi:anti-sigma regulatory factor (Ser/Thr protein kinase)